MRAHKLALVLPLLLLVACDSDGDGLSNSEEEEHGTDPEVADTDGDGLLDGEEIEFSSDPTLADTAGDGLDDLEEQEHGTDPTSTDTDADGYPDGDEISAGSDPTDAASMIYTGGWPYNADKDSMGAPDISSAGSNPGDLFARLQLVDQHGDTVDVYDFFGQGKPVAIDISAIWCPPCNGLSEWLSGKGDSYGFDGHWGNVKTMVDSGDMYWITILGQDASGNAEPPVSDLEAWDEQYPHELIPVLSGTEDVAAAYINYAWPSVYFMDSDGSIIDGPDGTEGGHWDGMNEANAYTP